MGLVALLTFDDCRRRPTLTLTRPTRESFGKATRDVKCEVKAAKCRVDERYNVADAEFGEVLGYHLGRATV